LSPQRAGFDPEPGLVWFVLDKVSLALLPGILSRVVLMDVSEEPVAIIIKVTLICRPKQAADKCP
jgi:hypothetical protein